MEQEAPFWKKSVNAAAGNAAVDALHDNLLAESQKQRNSESYLRRFIGDAYELVNPSGAAGANSAAAIDTARDRLQTRTEVASYGAEFVKTACLFLPGARWITAGAYGLDQAKPSDSWQTQLLDGAAGVGKGHLLKLTFNKTAQIENIGERALTLGLTTRAIDVGLTRENWIDRTTGEASALAGARNLGMGVFNGHAVMLDLAIMGGAHVGVKGLNKLTKNAVAESAFLSTTLTGTTFGLMTGAMQEIETQLRSGNSGEFDWSRIARRSLIKGGLDTIAAMPGGIMTARNLAATRPPEITPTERMPVQVAGRRLSEGLTRATDGIQDPLVMKPTRAGQWSEALAIPEAERVPLADLHARLSAVESRTVQLIKAKNGVEDISFESGTRFLETATTKVETPVRVYSVKGHETRIVVPEEYAIELDAVRTVRFQLEGKPRPEGAAVPDVRLLDRALPEDIIPLLDRLPDSRLVREVVLSPEHNPLDPWHGHKAGDSNFVSAASANEYDGTITFFRRNKDSALSLEFQHEWSHLLRAASPTEARRFDLASSIERSLPRSRAGVDEHENWSVAIGENLLSPKQVVFSDYAQSSPIRTWLAAQALQRSLSESSGTLGPAQTALQTRLQAIEREIKPIAIERLLEKAKAPDAEGNAAVRLLVDVGESGRLTPGSVADINLSGGPFGDWHVAQLGRLQPKSVDISGTRTQNVDALAIPSIERLNLSGTKISDSALWIVDYMPNLQELRLQGTSIGNGAEGYLSGAKQLKLLDVRGTGMTTNAIQRLRAALGGTQILH